MSQFNPASFVAPKRGQSPLMHHSESVQSLTRRTGLLRAPAAASSCGFSSAVARHSSASSCSAAAKASSDMRLSRTSSSRRRAIGHARSRNERRPMVSGSAVTARTAAAPIDGSALPSRRERVPATVRLQSARLSRWYQSPVVSTRAPVGRSDAGSSFSRIRRRRWSSTPLCARSSQIRLVCCDLGGELGVASSVIDGVSEEVA